jgi:hypothetical protein
MNYTWGADGVAKENFAGINIWCICGIPEGVIYQNEINWLSVDNETN